jgi:hypothetical protein
MAIELQLDMTPWQKTMGGFDERAVAGDVDHRCFVTRADASLDDSVIGRCAHPRRVAPFRYQSDAGIH